MRIFILLCFVAVATAQYDYTPNQVDVSSHHHQHHHNRGSAQLSLPIQTPQISEFNKEFYTYTAPDQEFDDSSANEQIANSMKRNLRVVFIKGPENAGLENAALQLAKAVSQDRTAIYVLNKQADISDLAGQLQVLKSASNARPEVHFVKYRTDEDAENAQRTIQLQYDSLPGPSSNHNAGSATVLDFASKSAALGATTSSHSSGGSTSPAQNAYLPPSKRRF